MYDNETGGEKNGYQNYGYRIDPQYQPQEAYRYVQDKPKKKSSFAGKAVTACVIGLFFGVFAAAGFYGVNALAGRYGLLPQTTQAVNNNAGHIVASGTAVHDESMISVPTLNSSSTTVVTDVTQVVEQAMPSIVSIVNHGTEEYFYYSIPSDSSGSGIIIGQTDDELLIVTNYHVVAKADTLTVTFTDDSEAEAQVKGTDASMDLAVIAVPTAALSGETLDAIRIATMGDSDNLHIGEPAIVIGNALGYGQSVTTGVISALNRERNLENGSGTYIQTDAAINPGNSGGALLNINGEVIGINSNKIGGNVVEGMGYAIPISAAKPIIEELMQHTTRTLVDEKDRGYLGITGATVTSQEAFYYGYPQGVYISGVNKNSAAEDAGMQTGDILVGFDGESITSMEQLQRLLMYYSAGTTVELEVKRPDGNDYRDMTLKITLGDKSVLGRTN